MSIYFDKDKLMKDYLNFFYAELAGALISWKEEVLSGMTSEFAKKHGPKVSFELDIYAKGVTAYLKANPAVLMDSYGTGSLMDENNPGLQEYMNSERWNPARTGKAIVGRPEGDYINVFGQEKYSSGYLEGLPLEGTETMTGFKFKAIPPSGTLKNAKKRLFDTYLKAAYRNALKHMKFSNYIIEKGK